MRISQTPQTSTPSFETLGRVLRAGATRSPSVELPDVLELSSLGELAGSLGPGGIEALHNLAGQSGLGEERLADFVSNLFSAGTAGNRVDEVLSTLSGIEGVLGKSGLGDLFSEIESRGVSGELKYLDGLDNLFNLGHRNIPSLFAAGQDLSEEEFGVFLSSLSTLLQNGVVGTVTVEFRGQPTTVFIENEMGSEYARAPLYPKRFGT